jgi:imidazolonepropionase-like amidohydrolase
MPQHNAPTVTSIWSVPRLALLLVALSFLGSRAPYAQARPLVIAGATVISGADSAPRTEASVVIEGGHIACIGSPATCPEPRGARTINGRGRWLIPGFFDAHVHITEEQGHFGPLYLAFGITSVRDVGGYVDLLLALRARIVAGAALGPRIYLAGNPIDGDPPEWPPLYPSVPVVVRTADEARKAVRKAKVMGVDFIKLYHGLNPSLLAAAASEAHRQGLKATADLNPWRFAPDSALGAGLDGFEHTVPPPNGDFEIWTHDSAQMNALVDRIRASGAAVTTTMVLSERFLPSIPTQEPTYQALPPRLQQRSAVMVRGSRSGRTLSYTCRTARALAAKGGLVLAGTDSYFMVSYPGDLHRELELLVGCGLTPKQALAAGTRNPARWLGADTLGTIERGKVADLVLLRGDPLADIRQSRRIELVITRGQVHRPSALIANARE